ncbi:ribonuclease H-like domain-containing protein, partial [Tanacetum coccineum]
MVTVRCLLSVVVSQSWLIFQLDVNNAFLYRDLYEDVYMKPPEGYFPSDLRKLKYFLGIEVVVTDKGICLNQRKYVLDLLSKYVMLACKPVDTHLLSKLVISNEATTCDPVFENITDYQKLMGLGIYFVKTFGMSLSAFSDADWANKKQNSLSKSSTEVEYRALASVTSEDLNLEKYYGDYIRVIELVMNVLKKSLNFDKSDKGLCCESASSSSSEFGGISVTADFPINFGNDADSSNNNFATQNEEVTTLGENVFSEGNMNQNPNTVSQDNQNLRRSSRQSVFPKNYNDFVVDSKVKYGIENGEIDRFKARLMAHGFGQKDGIGYEETFSHVVKMVTMEDVYMRPPERYFPSGNKVCKLKKSLYGLKQAPRQWNAKLTSTLIENGFSQSKSDYSFFTKTDKGVFLALLVYVDDIIITGNNVAEIEKFKVFLKSKFIIKDLGKLKYFLGIEVVDTDKGICLNQRKYVLDTPLLSKLVISNEATTCDPVLENITDYQKLMGKLIYLTNIRPDISYDVHCLSQFMHSPLKSHLKTAFKILRYLKSCSGLGIHFVKTFGMSLSAFSDADWANKKQNSISKSSTEAEYRALASVTSEVISILKFLKDLKIKNLLPVNLHCDSNSAIKIASNPIFHERTKHLEIDLHFVRDFLKGVVKTVKVDYANQITDVFTKGLGIVQHNCFWKSLECMISISFNGFEVITDLHMERGFLSQKGSEVGRGVKEKQVPTRVKSVDRTKTNTDVGTGLFTESDGTLNDANPLKEVVSPYVIDEHVAMEVQSPLVAQTYSVQSPVVEKEPVATKRGYSSHGLTHIQSDMSMQSLDRSSYARVMIELRADVELKDNIVVAMPKITREGHYTCNVRVEYEWKPPRCSSCKVFGHIHEECPKNTGAGEKKTVKKPSQTSRGVSVGPKMGFKPHKEYRLVPKKSTASSSGNKKKCVEPTIEVSNSNPFDVLNLVDNDGEFGTNRGTTNLVNNEATSSGSSFMHVDNDGELASNTPIVRNSIISSDRFMK